MRASVEAVDELGLLRAGGHRRALPPRRLALDGDLSGQLGSWDGAVAAAARASSRSRDLTAEEVRQRTGSPVHLGAAFEAGAATVQPALLARGLRRVAVGRGVRIFERSMLELDRDRGVVRTPSGSVEAGAIVLATGAWLAGVKELGRAVVAVERHGRNRADAGATRPGRLDGRRVDLQLPADGALLPHDQDGRIAFGQGGHRHAFGGRVDDGFFGRGEAAERRLRTDLVRLVPYAAGVEVTHGWGGPIDRTIDGAPIFGRLPGSVPIVYGAGYWETGSLRARRQGRSRLERARP